MIPAPLQVVLIALGCAVPVAVAGWVALRLLGRRSIVASVSAVVLSGVLGVVAGIIGTSYAMFLSAHDLGVVLTVLASAGTVALVSALALGRRLARQSVFQQEAAARERALEASRRELVAWVSHDLRTPLAGLRAMSEALEDGVVSEPAQVARYHAAMTREADRLAAMVDDLFELSRIHAGALRLQLDALSLADVVSDAVAAVHPAAAAKRVRILADRAAAWPMVNGSDPELGRVVRNLLTNAVRHTPPDGTVRLAAGADGDSAWLAVQDACGGIPPADLSRVFEVAFRGEPARPAGAGAAGGTGTAGPGPAAAGLASGAGLGLAIARGLVEAHQGRIAVENAGPGCRFVIRLPAVSRPA
ncbi:MAG TPA: ATP-binding protein [Mycobacteriales bacterium]